MGHYITSPLNYYTVGYFTETETNQYSQIQGSISMGQIKTDSRTVIIVVPQKFHFQPSSAPS